MQMAVDETRRRHGAAAVNHLLAGEPLRDLDRLVDRDDLALVYCDRCVANDAALGINRDQPIDIGDEQVDGLHAGLRLALQPSCAGLTSHPSPHEDGWIAGSSQAMTTEK